MTKQSSKDILNELFSKFNAKFEDIEESNSSDSSSDSDAKSKKKKKKKVKKSKEKGKTQKRKSADKEKDKRRSKKRKKKSNDEDKGKEGKNTDEQPKFKPSTIKLDIEEGEIIDEEEKAKRKSVKKKQKVRDDAEEVRKHGHHHHHSSGHTGGPSPDESEKKKLKRRSESLGSESKVKSHHRHEDSLEYQHHQVKREDSRDYSSSYRRSPSPSSDHRRKSTSSSRQREGERNESPVRRTAPPREGDRDRENTSPSRRRSSYVSSYRSHWQKASRDTDSYASEKTYFYNANSSSRRRSDSYDDYSRSDRYYGSRSGFGYSGSSKYYDDDAEDNYYDYRRSSKYRSRRSRSRSRSPRSSRRSRDPDDVIDKAKLLEIARRNASKLLRKGCLPTDIFTRDQIAAIRAGGKSLEELTDYCRKLAEKDAKGDLKDNETDSDDEHFINHPFQVKERPMPSIVMNIRNAIPLPVRSAQELALEGAKLRTQFPVSSGTRHRYKELEWHPVDEEEEKAKNTRDESKSLVPVDGPKVGTVAPMPQNSSDSGCGSGESEKSSSGPLAITDGTIEEDKAPVKSKSKSDTIDPAPTVTVDISTIISMRLRAMRQLEDDPEDEDAKETLELASKEMKNWAATKALEPKFLTQAEITAGPQAWARKDQLKNTVQLTTGMGIHLLQKMGWKPGEGLGKNKEGNTEPLLLDVKMDKRGLASSADLDKGPSMPGVFDLSSKHPVSALMELSMKRRWGPPGFQLCFEDGRPDKKHFLYKVIVNGMEYQPQVASKTKKLAKAYAAAFCLQSLGLLPTKKPEPAETLKTVAAPTIPKATTSTVTSSKPVEPVLGGDAPHTKPQTQKETSPTTNQPHSSPSPMNQQQNNCISPPTPPSPVPSTPSIRPTPPRTYQHPPRPPPPKRMAPIALPVRPHKYPLLNPEFKVPRNPPTRSPMVSAIRNQQYLAQQNQGMNFSNFSQVSQFYQHQQIANYRYSSPTTTVPVRPMLQPARPPLQSYEKIPQNQLESPNSGGFPGLITF